MGYSAIACVEGQLAPTQCGMESLRTHYGFVRKRMGGGGVEDGQVSH